MIVMNNNSLQIFYGTEQMEGANMNDGFLCDVT